MIRTIIVDDDYQIRKGFKRRLEKQYEEKLDIVATAKDVEEAVQKINQFEPDLVFLDVDMPDGTGFDVINRIEKIPIVVLVTASVDHGIEAVNRGIFHYIVKPVDNDELDKSINKVESEFHSNKTVDFNPGTVSLSTQEGFFRIKNEDIMYCISEGNYSTFYMRKDRKILISKPSKYAEEKLSNTIFFRINRSVIVNIMFVDKLDRENYLHMLDGTRFRVSITYKKEIKEQIF